ncbi:ankyrin repeat domain-containing protein [Legionella cardiaca]|uniref:Ankyrin repeat domain-containing protein n=1 Tax=Legionella cardiaca TaxID=1071983 RepID=A0ABY8ANT2_9GAMM|nr:ankyrin repeat domain-containing protein [Legionella cardiaca]WED42218.1 ankyrin repeat domain-containing protein [Legionella cardiaca]
MLKVINLMTELKYKNISEKGICAGLTLMWMQAWLSGREEEIKFFNRLNGILNSNKSNKELAIEIEAVRKKIKAGFPVKKLTDEEYNLLEIVAFFDGIQLYQKPSKHPDFLLGKHLSQVDIETISIVTASDAIQALGNLKKIFSEPGAYNKQELENYLNDLCSIIADEYDKLAISISSGQHRFGLRYDKPSKQWIMVEQTLLGEKIERYQFETEDLASFIKGVFLTDESVIFNIDIFATNNKLPSNSVIEKLNQFREQHLTAFNKQRAEKKTSYTEMTIAHIAAYYGHLDYLAKYSKFKIPLDKTTNEGYTPLHFAARSNQLEAMELLLQSTNALNVAANDGVTATYIAAEEGFTEMLCKMMARGANVLQIGPDNKSALDLALENKQMRMVLVILTTINPRDLTKTQLNTLQKYRKELLRECINFIKNLDENVQIKYLSDIRDSNNALGFIFNHHKPSHNPYKLFKQALNTKTDEMKEIAKTLEGIISTARFH